MRLLVTGCGLIGREIVKYHVDKGDRVYWQDNESNPYMTYDNIPGERIGIRFDLPYFIKWNIDCVSIQASLVSVGQSTEQPQRYLDSNMCVVSTVIQAVKNSGKQIKIVHSGSMGGYGEPTELPTSETHPISPINIYGVSKAAQEDALRVASMLYNLDIISLRYFSVTGSGLSLDNPNTGVINFMVKQALGGRIEINDNGMQTRDIIDVRDVARAHYLAAHKNIKGFTPINIGTGKSYSLKTVAEMIRVKMGTDIEIVCNNKKRAGDIVSSQANISRAEALLNWKPEITIDAMIDEYVKQVQVTRHK